MLKGLVELQGPCFYHEFYDNVSSASVLWCFSSKVHGQGPVSIVTDKDTENMLFYLLPVS